MKVSSYNGGKVAHVEYDEKPFCGKVTHRLLKDAVVMYQANIRQGSHQTK